MRVSCLYMCAQLPATQKGFALGGSRDDIPHSTNEMLAQFPDGLTKIHSKKLSLPALSHAMAAVQAEPTDWVWNWGVPLPAHWALPILQLLLRLSPVSGPRMPEQLPGVCQTQRFLLFLWRNGLHSLKGRNPFAGIHVVSRNTRI